MNELKEKIEQLPDFDEWWNMIGSGLRPLDGEDIEEHTKSVCRHFYQFITQHIERF